MKYIKIAESAAGLFGKKTEVILENIDGNKLGNFKLEEIQVPETFNKPLVIELGNVCWRILAAKEIREKSILRSRKVLLTVTEALHYQNERFMVPTYAYPIPEYEMMKQNGLNCLVLTKEDWRQYEFLPASLNTIMQEELSAVEIIINAETNGEQLLGFEKTHIRESIGSKILSISIDCMKALLKINSEGIVIMDGRPVRNSFFIKTSLNVYYGIYEGSLIRELCLFDFQSVDDEFMIITTSFDLMMADWCNAGYYYMEKNATNETLSENQNDDMNII